MCNSSTYGIHCPPDEYKPNGTSCGNCGQCSNGACTNQGECEPGSTRSCGSCGTQTCLDNCTWGTCEDKGGEGADCFQHADCCSGICHEGHCITPKGFNPSEGDTVAVGGIDGEEGNFIITSDFALGSGEVAGTETGTIYIKGNVTLNEDSTLIWGKGGAVKLLDNAKIIFISSASGSGTLVRAGEKILADGDSHINRRACICVKDQDGDGYWVTSSAELSTDTFREDCDSPGNPVECDSGYVSLNSSNLKGRGDCDDTSNLRWQEVTGYTPDNDGDYYASSKVFTTACCGEGNWDGQDTSTWYKHCDPKIAPWYGDCDDSTPGYGPGDFQIETQSCTYYEEGGSQGTRTCVMFWEPGTLFGTAGDPDCDALLDMEVCSDPPCDFTGGAGTSYHCAYPFQPEGEEGKCYYCGENCHCNPNPSGPEDLCGTLRWTSCISSGSAERSHFYAFPGFEYDFYITAVREAPACNDTCSTEGATETCETTNPGYYEGTQSHYRQCDPNGSGDWGEWSDWSPCTPGEYQQH